MIGRRVSAAGLAIAGLVATFVLLGLIGENPWRRAAMSGMPDHLAMPLLFIAAIVACLPGLGGVILAVRLISTERARDVEWAAAASSFVAGLAPFEAAARAQIARRKACAAKPRVRIRPDGWIRHRGGPFPFDDACRVRVILAGGVSWDDPAGRWPETWWRGLAGQARNDVRFYRFLSPCYPRVNR